MLHLLPLFPELLHLELGLNNFQDLSEIPSSHEPPKLLTLNLQENGLYNWNSIIRGLADFKR